MPWYRIPQSIADRTDEPALKALYEARVDAAGDGYVHINLGRRKRAPAACCVCGWISSRLCDRIVNPDILVHGEPRRCDRPLCEWCTTSPASGKDLCPECALLYKGWLAARTNSTDGEGP